MPFAVNTLAKSLAAGVNGGYPLTEIGGVSTIRRLFLGR